MRSDIESLLTPQAKPFACFRAHHKNRHKGGFHGAPEGIDSQVLPSVGSRVRLAALRLFDLPPRHHCASIRIPSSFRYESILINACPQRESNLMVSKLTAFVKNHGSRLRCRTRSAPCDMRPAVRFPRKVRRHFSPLAQTKMAH